MAEPVRVLNCEACSLPAEYCEFGPDFERCKPWLIRNAPDIYPDLLKGVEGIEDLQLANQLESTKISKPSGSAAAGKQEEVKCLPGGMVKKKATRIS